MNGIIPLWKPKGITSAGCVYKLRKILHTKKIGHTGTLDPDVEGVLPICVGTGTKLVEYLVDSHKVYDAEITFGFSTTTEDASGEVVQSKSFIEGDISNEVFDNMTEQFIGTITQIPPMFSAVKVNGKELYKYARAGETVERPERTVTIYGIERTSDVVEHKNNQTASVSVRIICSKGTYIRTLAVDLGEALGYPTHMSKLLRTYSGGIDLNQTVTFKEIEKAMENQSMDNVMLSLTEAFTKYPQVELSDDLYNRVRNGAILRKDNFPDDQSYPVSFIYENELIAIYKTYEKDQSLIKPQKIIQVRS